MLRRIVPFVVSLTLLANMVPQPALAMSTQAEIAAGQAADSDIVQTYVIETDPLLNAYVKSIGDKLFAGTARKDVPYNIKIIKAGDVNAFSTLGGYVYVYEGLIDFVQSDDELAGVIGHETGHIERRHVVSGQAKAQALNLLFGIASLFSPFLYNFGNLIQAGIQQKMSRADEIQADRYGLQLMSRAGYDPQAMLTMLDHLGTLEDEHSDIVTRYLADHPASPDRIKHLVGYPELDPTKVTTDQLLVQAVSDEERARYHVAMLELQQVLKKDPGNAEALLKLGQAQLALGQTSKSEQTLAEAAQKGNGATQAVAQERITALRSIDSRRVSLTRPNLDRLRTALNDAQQQLQVAASQIQVRRDQGRAQLKNLQARVDAIGYELPDLSNVQIRNGSRIEAIVKNLEGMSRALNSGMDDAGNAIGGPGSLDRGKESGLLRESADVLKQMRAPLDAAPIPTDSLAVLPSYPAMLQNISDADADMLRGVDAGRASVLMIDQAMGDLDEFLRPLQHAQMNFSGDISQLDYNAIVPLMQKANDSINKAATAAAQSAQLYNMARSRQLQTRVAMLGLGTSPERYATLRYALGNRFSSDDGTYDGISWDAMIKQNLNPGDVTVATIVAADTKTTTQAIIDDAKLNHRSMVDEANARGMHAWPLEIFTGLMYLDYTDDPADETRRNGDAASPAGITPM
ncbi:MAG TPA: M48 family metalloprotease [Candidatus Baltobacteraceae bacterium]|jgi:predicted Zn-dependent protease